MHTISVNGKMKMYRICDREEQKIGKSKRKFLEDETLNIFQEDSAGECKYFSQIKTIST